MKKSLRILIALSVVASTVFSLQPASAISIGTLYNGTSGDVACTTGGTATGFFTILANEVTGNTGCTGTLNIPSGVTTIANNAFDETSNVTSLTIPSTVDTIGSYAFYGLGSITSLTIPSSVTSIGNYAFTYASSLTTLTIPSGISTIGNGVFYGLGSLTSLTIPSNITTIGADAFLGASALTTLNISSSVTSIGARAFFGASALITLNIPNSVTSIGSGAFYGASSLTTLTIPDSVTIIDVGAFNGVSSLTSLTIPSTVTSLGNYAFYGASSLTTLNIPNSVSTIGYRAFMGASALRSLSLGTGITSVDSTAFEGATSLKYVNIPFALYGNPTVFNSTVDAFNRSVVTFAIGGTYTAPGVPTSLTATATGTTTADVSFTAPVSNGGATITSYIATSSPGGITGTISQAGSGTIRITGLTTSTAYTFSIKAVTAAGISLVSNASNSITTYGLPGVPGSVVATTTGKRSATVSFTAPASNGGSAITSYTASSTPGGFTQTLTQSVGGTFTFDGLLPNTSYVFAVTATNAIGISSATSSNSIKTDALVVAALSTLSFVDDGNGTSGKIVWAGMNIESVLYTGPKEFYPGPFNYGAFTSGWNGRIRNLTPNTTYDISIVAFSADGVGGQKSLTFTTNVAPPNTQNIFDSLTGISIVTPLPVLTEDEKLVQLLKWVEQNTYLTGEASRMSKALTDFANLNTSRSSTRIRLPIPSVLTVMATSLTPLACSVVSPTADVDAGILTVLTTGKCTISYTVSGGSSAPATLVRDFVFTYFELKCGSGTYRLKAGFVSNGESCTGAVTIDASATSMANAAFVGSLITSITLPNSITKIPDYAFAETFGLTKVELGNAVSTIGTGAFRSAGIASILLPTSLRTLGNSAFLGSAITSLIIPVGTTTVGSSVVQSSLVLKTVTIPSTVTYMHPTALLYSGASTINYCGENASVLKAIYNSSSAVRITATCVAPTTAP